MLSAPHSLVFMQSYAGSFCAPGRRIVPEAILNYTSALFKFERVQISGQRQGQSLVNRLSTKTICTMVTQLQVHDRTDGHSC
jgi:hypothetical protein